MSKWKPIKSAPKDRAVLVWAGKYIKAYVAELRAGHFNEPSPDAIRWRDTNGRWGTPTHWMELPKPPKQEEE